MAGLFSFAVLAVFAICLLIEVLNGRKHGIIRSGVSFGCVLLSIIFGVVIANVISSAIAPVTMQLLNSVDGLDEIKELIPSFDSIGAAYIQMFVAPIVFLFVFLVLRLIFAIIESILFHTALKNLPGNPRNESKKVKAGQNQSNGNDQPVNPEADNRPLAFRKTRLFGALIGILSAFFVVVALVAPFKGMFKTFQPVVNALAEIDSEEEPLLGDGGTETVKNLVDGGADDPAGSFTYALGGKVIYNSLAAANIDGNRVKLSNEVEQIGSAVTDLLAIVPVFESGNKVTDNQVNKMEGLGAKVGKSQTLKVLLSEFLSNASKKWLDGEEVLGMGKPDMGEITASTVDCILEIFEGSKTENIEGDVTTIFRVVAKLAKSGILNNAEDFQQMLTSISDTGVVGEIYKDLQSNERMSDLVEEIKNLGLRALASAINIPTNRAEQYNSLMNDFAGALNNVRSIPENQRSGALAVEIDKLTEEYGVDVPDDIAEEVAEALLKDFGNGENVEAQAVEEFFKVYAAASSGNVTKAPDEINGFDRLANESKGITFNEDGYAVLPDGTVLTYYTKSMLEDSGAYRLITENAGDLASLASAESMKTCVMTLEDILKAARSVVDIDPDKEAELLNQLVLAASKIVDITSKEKFEVSELIESLGEILDTISASDLFGSDAASSLMTAILQSPTVTEITGLSVVEAYDLAKSACESAGKEGNSYVTSLKSVADAVDVVKSVSDNSLTDEEIEAKIRKLIDDLTPDNATILEKMIRPSLLKKYNVPDENADSVSDMIARLFHNMAEYQGSEADYDREAAAVKHLFDMAMTCKNGSGKRAFNGATGNGVLKQTADEFVESFAGSEVVSKTLNESVYKDNKLEMDALGIAGAFKDADKADLYDALGRYYESHRDQADIGKTLAAIAAIAGIQYSVNR